MVIVSPTLACALPPAENITIGGRGNLGDHLTARTREIVLLKAGIGVDVARGRLPTRATSLPPH